MIEAASGQSYQDYIQVHIYDKLGLKNVGLLAPVTGHTYENGAIAAVPYRDIKTYTAAGGLFANAELMCRFGSALSAGRSTLISEETKKLLFTEDFSAKDTGPDFPGGCAKGFLVYEVGKFEVKKQRLVGHDGLIPGSKSCTLMNPETGLVVVVLENGDGGAPRELAKSISLFYGKRSTMP